jgi:hypothetical protein
LGERERLCAAIEDRDLIEYFYLDQDMKGVFHTLEALDLRLDERPDVVPFNAAVKGYIGAVDGQGNPWIAKRAETKEALLYFRLCTLAYLIDHRLGTLAAPTGVAKIDSKLYRITKVVRNSIQIGSYNYLEEPYLEILRKDLLNRWLFFDEDRNPNNYLVVRNRKEKPFVVVIDYDKADLASENMKITGDPDKFGWFRTEKTRFLSPLRPPNFEGVPIDVFENRLKEMVSITREELLGVAMPLLEGHASSDFAGKIVDLLLARVKYIEEYFRRMFKSATETKNKCNDSDYSMFGASFIDMYKGKK